MALNGYMSVEGDTQGRIEGSATQSGYEGAMEVYGWSHEVIAPRDAASGLPTGKRQHKPFNVTKPVDKASPLLMQALTTNESLSTVTLRLFQTNGGREEQAYTVELVNASVVGVRTEMLNNKYPENASHEMREFVSFTYQSITWTWLPDSLSSSDDWSVGTER